MNFKDTLISAKANDTMATMRLVNQYRPLLIKFSLINGNFDEDLYQNLIVNLLVCIQLFRI